MIKIKKIAILLCMIGMFFCFGNSVLAQEAFDIDHYDVQIVVEEDGTYHVTEELRVTFTELRHGIYLQIPTTYRNVRWTFEDRVVERDYYFPVNDIRVLSNHEADISSENEGITIKMGSANSYANQQETYSISYSMHSKDLGLEGIQTFYQNIISNLWDTSIHGATFKITMPKAFDANQVNFYTEGTQVDENLNYVVQGNTIEGSYKGILSNGKGLTIKVDLPEDYFVYPSYTSILYAICGLSIALLGIVVFLFFKYGKDNPVVKTVEFKAPKGLSSAGVGYIIDGAVDKQDVISLIFDWANKGYITMKEVDDDLEFTKVKDLDASSHHYENILFNGMFKKADITSTNALSTEIYQDFMNSIKAVQEYFDTKKNRIYTSNSLVLRTLVGFVAGLPVALYVAVAIYSYSYSGMTALISLAVIVIVITLGCALQNIGVQRWQAPGPTKLILVAVGLVLIVLTGLISLSIYTAFGLGQVNFFIMSLLITIVMCLFSNFMLKRTVQGTKYYGQVLGLKEFIQVAEKDRLDMLVRDDPKYFYNILPYAYALGLSDVWGEHFKDLEIEAPTWYTGSTSSPFMNYYMIHSMANRLNTLQNPIPPVSATEGRGGGFGGGGFGGGGFGGGGFGGTSGGSW